MEHHDTPPRVEPGRQIWRFTSDEVIAILKAHVGAGGGIFRLWGVAPHLIGSDKQSHLTLVRDYEP